MSVTIAALHVYPVKSCKGIALTQAMLTPMGVQSDRRWMIVNAFGRFVTQRELPRMALIETALIENGVRLSVSSVDGSDGLGSIDVIAQATSVSRNVTVWRDTLGALDEGNEAAHWLSDFLNASVRLVRFDSNQRRVSSRDYTGDVESLNQFSDGYAMLAISEASLADLNNRLSKANVSLPSLPPLLMNRFRPNIVLAGLDAYGEDRVHEFYGGGVRLRVVKPCTRCKITTVDQATGVSLGDEPITTLKSYRWDESLRGVAFGQNVIVIEGVGQTLSVGQSLQASLKT